MRETSSPKVAPPDASAGTPRDIRIMGAGHFGRLAALRLSKRYPEAGIVVVDGNEDKLRVIEETLGLPVHVGEAVAYLKGEVLPDTTWIIPAVPIHVAFRWMLSRCEEFRAIAVPEAVDGQVPNPYRVPEGTVYSSFATFRCPDACNEPDEICTHTKKPRPGNLFEVLGRIVVPGFGVVVVRSLQLAPGVGGYTVAQLNAALDAAVSNRGNCIVATACRCHGVIDAMSRE